jgi:hypothetical protein
MTASKPKADHRKFNKTFYTIKAPPMDNDWKEGGLEITSYFNNVMDYVMDKDKKAIIHMWDNKPGIHLSKKSEPLKNRVQTRKYANNLCLRQGFPVSFRLRVSHSVIPSLIEVDFGQGRSTHSIGSHSGKRSHNYWLPRRF